MVVPPPTTARSHRPIRRRRGLLATVGFAVAAVVVAGCLPPPPPPPPLTPITAGVTHAVATRQFAFVDTSRATPAYGGYPGAASRQLPTTVWYPSDGGGPFPLVVFVHGYGSTPATYAPLLRRIASGATWSQPRPIPS